MSIYITIIISASPSISLYQERELLIPAGSDIFLVKPKTYEHNVSNQKTSVRFRNIQFTFCCIPFSVYLMLLTPKEVLFIEQKIFSVGQRKATKLKS